MRNLAQISVSEALDKVFHKRRAWGVAYCQEARSIRLTLMQYRREKSWEVPLEIVPAQPANPSVATRSEIGLFGSNNHSNQNARRPWAFFSLGVAAEYSRAHAVFPLHLNRVSFRRLSTTRKCQLEHSKAHNGSAGPSRRKPVYVD